MNFCGVVGGNLTLEIYANTKAIIRKAKLELKGELRAKRRNQI